MKKHYLAVLLGAAVTISSVLTPVGVMAKGPASASDASTEDNLSTLDETEEGNVYGKVLMTGSGILTIAVGTKNDNEYWTTDPASGEEIGCLEVDPDDVLDYTGEELTVTLTEDTLLYRQVVQESINTITKNEEKYFSENDRLLVTVERPITLKNVQADDLVVITADDDGYAETITVLASCPDETDNENDKSEENEAEENVFEEGGFAADNDKTENASGDKSEDAETDADNSGDSVNTQGSYSYSRGYSYYEWYSYSEGYVSDAEQEEQDSGKSSIEPSSMLNTGVAIPM